MTKRRFLLDGSLYWAGLTAALALYLHLQPYPEVEVEPMQLRVQGVDRSGEFVCWKGERLVEFCVRSEEEE